MQSTEQPSYAQLNCDGFEIVHSVCDPSVCEVLIAALSGFLRSRPTQSANRRNLLQNVPEVLAAATQGPIHTLVNSRSPVPLRPIRAILFDKTPDANWPVAWHQDQIVAVAARVEVEGFTAWSVKEGLPHVRPPVAILEGMITARLHLDDCLAANGALQILPGSHRVGFLSDAAIDDWRREVLSRICEVPLGGVLLMKPLLLHASSPSSQPGHRRVLHIEYAPDTLPGGLRWPAFASKEAE